MRPLRLEPEGAKVTGRIWWSGKEDVNKQTSRTPIDLLALPIQDIREIRGREIAMVFQEPMTALNPLFTVGNQIVEAVQVYQPLISKADCMSAAIELLKKTGIPEPETRFHSYPHQLSGGQRQRAMIAMALACKPRLLIADEPTTALDVTIQAQILDLLRDLRKKLGMSVLLITHNFGIVANFADRVLVMLDGKLVEQGPVKDILRSPQHPYTRALLDCIPRLGQKTKRLASIDRATLLAS